MPRLSRGRRGRDHAIRAFADAGSCARSDRLWITLARKRADLPERGERYHVAWREAGGVEADGSLQLERERLRLRGRTRRGEEALALLPYAELTGIRIGRAAEESLRGRPTVMLERGNQPPLAIAPFGAGLLSELADLLATLAAARTESAEQVAVIVPLKRNVRERARALVAQGPPPSLPTVIRPGHRPTLGYVSLSPSGLRISVDEPIESL